MGRKTKGMDDQAMIKTYGNPTLPEATPERPLVTFALFAYNQEKYIREAVEGAFSQTYSPLEIILSDDCSSDRTFEIMEEMAREYRGPHNIRIRRNSSNQETAQHFSNVAGTLQGILLVVAAGDDISKPERTEKLVEMWVNCHKEPGLYFSNLISFTDGQLPTSGKIEDSTIIENKKHLRKMLINGDPIFGIYAKSAMYSRDLLSGFPPLLGGSVVEDGPMICRAILTGSVHHSSAPLVYSRIDGRNVGMDLSLAKPRHWNRLFRSRIIAAFTVLRDIEHINTLSKGEISKLEHRFISQINNLSRFIIPESGRVGRIRRFKLAINFLLGRAYPRFPKTSIVMALRVLGLR